MSSRKRRLWAPAGCLGGHGPGLTCRMGGSSCSRLVGFGGIGLWGGSWRGARVACPSAHERRGWVRDHGLVVPPMPAGGRGEASMRVEVDRPHRSRMDHSGKLGVRCATSIARRWSTSMPPAGGRCHLQYPSMSGESGGGRESARAASGIGHLISEAAMTTMNQMVLCRAALLPLPGWQKLHRHSDETGQDRMRLP